MNNISNSVFGLGLTRILEDLGFFLMIIGPSVGLVSAIFFLIRRSMAEGPDAKMWEKRSGMAIVCGIATLLVGAMMNLLGGYFGVSV